MTQFDPSRRKFIISSTAGVSGLMIAQSALGGAVVNLLDPGSPLVLPENFTPCVWFTMQSSGEANIHIFKQELGQHVGTAFAQIVAEELDLDWSKVNIDYPEMDSVQVQKTGSTTYWRQYECVDQLYRTGTIGGRCPSVPRRGWRRNSWQRPH